MWLEGYDLAPGLQSLESSRGASCCQGMGPPKHGSHALKALGCTQGLRWTRGMGEAAPGVIKTLWRLMSPANWRVDHGRTAYHEARVVPLLQKRSGLQGTLRACAGPGVWGELCWGGLKYDGV